MSKTSQIQFCSTQIGSDISAVRKPAFARLQETPHPTNEDWVYYS